MRPDADAEALLARVLESVAPSEWLRARRLVETPSRRYGRGDHIVKHDDAAVVDIDGVPHERRMARWVLPGEPTWDARSAGSFWTTGRVVGALRRSTTRLSPFASRASTRSRK